MFDIIIRSVSVFAKLLPKPVINALYRSDTLGRTIRGNLNRIAPDGMTEITVASGDLSGMKLALDLHSEKDYWLGTYEPELQKAVKDFVTEGMVVYDVGANIGYYSLLFANTVGESGQVYAFEALPDHIQRIHTNLALNNLTSRVHVIQAAVVDSERSTHLMVGPSGAMGKVEGSAGRQDVTYRESITVNGISLDRFVYLGGNPAPQVIKIDIEGGEVLALPGMQQLLKEAKPLIFLELHGPQAAELCWNNFSQFGYQLHRAERGYPLITNKDDLDWKAYIVAIYQV